MRFLARDKTGISGSYNLSGRDSRMRIGGMDSRM